VHGVQGRRRRVAAMAGATALALAACTGGSSAQMPTTSSPTTATIGPPSPSPSASLTPEQQAGEDAKAALLTYERTVDSVNQAGGHDPQMRLAEVAVGDQLRFLMQDAAQLRENGWRQVGSTAIKSATVGSVRLPGTPQVVLNICLDASNTDAVDSKGKSIRKPGSYTFFQETVTLVKQRDDWLVSQEDGKSVKTC
jgi:hypothetical protein